ncbi:DUF4244 domain-containing protein [Actinotalea sp. Marseille-Q4924]|uniref:DUF4244 domain-containing protein n=1 Tax=Actinotalea sp. Marseille-Q4924 TaxID=2866571 RepID=UPI001CE4871F|nr:DUF4244 domain-containing protein [Actinotalea sp. Marseille-Q4924]
MVTTTDRPSRRAARRARSTVQRGAPGAAADGRTREPAERGAVHEATEVAVGPRADRVVSSIAPRGRGATAPRPARWDDAGMATAEYAIATVAAAGFAGLLIAILRSDEVRGLLLGIVRGALSP